MYFVLKKIEEIIHIYEETHEKVFNLVNKICYGREMTTVMWTIYELE